MKLRKHHPVCLAGSVTLLLALAPTLASAKELPSVETACHPVTNVYHSTVVADPYQWLEEASAPAVREWTRLQNARTRAYFQGLPFRDGIAQQLAQLRGEESARYFGLEEKGGRKFALRFKPPAQQPVLVRLSSLQPPALWQVVFDPNTYDTNGTTTIDWYVPSLDGRMVAISLSERGSEQGTLHFFETDTGKQLADKIPRVQYPTGGGSAAWTADGSGILYTRYPHTGERPAEDLNFFQQIWFHKLGTPVEKDTYEAGRDFPRIAEIEMEASEDGRWISATVANGDGGDYAHYLRDSSGQWRQLTRFDDGVKVAKFGRDNALYLLQRNNDVPRGQVLRMPLDEPALASAKVAAPQSKGVVQDFEPSDHGLYVANLLGGPSELLYYERGSKRPREIPLLPVSAVSGLKCWHGDELVFGNLSYLKPFAWFAYHPQSGVRRTALYTTSPVDFDDLEVVREFATSKDGTKVPLNIVRKKGVRLDGQNPTLLYGYGGYSISLTPSFNSTRRVWFDAGGVYVVANLRGGGEFGEEWHKAGNLTRKQNVFDDFIAAAEHLIQRRYTNPSRLAVEGGSNGGLLMGALLTQRPELVKAVVSHVGIYDMLRVELDPNGQFNVTEFGTVKDREQFAALHAYSPYHRVRNGLKYPAVLLTTGENDGRVNPAQSRKMTAQLQAATSSANNPILFRSSASAGHGIGTALNVRISQEADVYAFLFDQLGVDAAAWIFQRPE